MVKNSSRIVSVREQVLVEENLTDFPGTFFWEILYKEEHIVTHVLTPEHTLLLTGTVCNRTFQTQELVVAMEMGSINDDSRRHNVTMTCVDQQIFDVTFQKLCYHSNCVVGFVTC